jgi:hypothetical protein
MKIKKYYLKLKVEERRRLSSQDGKLARMAVPKFVEVACGAGLANWNIFGAYIKPRG